MDLTDSDVQRILDLLDQSRFDYLQVEEGDLKIIASRSGVLPQGVNIHAGPAMSTPTPDAPSAPVPVPPSPPASVPQENVSQSKSTEVDREGLVVVKAPMIGTFYRAPEPGAPSFVEVGSSITTDTTLGLIEVMKVFNSVSSSTAGVIEAILIDNAEFVEFGQEIFLVRPENGR